MSEKKTNQTKSKSREEIVEVDSRFALLLTYCAGYKEQLKD